jgi:hypothetical protein
MTSNTITLQYGCPSCGCLRDTGEFKWVKTEKSTRLRTILWKHKILPKPTKKVWTQQPIYKTCGGPITFESISYRPTLFHCPHCNSDYKYQVRRWKNDEWITWSQKDDYLHGVHERKVMDCHKCGGKLTRYFEYLTYRWSQICRACGDSVNEWRDND